MSKSLLFLISESERGIHETSSLFSSWYLEKLDDLGDDDISLSMKQLLDVSKISP